MYRNTVCSDDNIVYLDEYKKSSLHQKRQQEQLYKKHETKKKPVKKNQKLFKSGDYSSKFIAFIIGLTIVGFICFGIAYFLNSNGDTKKTVTSINSMMAKY
ncbi:MAG: hypothetical protein ACM3X7_12685 [Solirubrobacterales bacterium]